MVYENQLSEEEARVLLSKLESLRYERESERIADIGICHLILKNHPKACEAFEQSYAMDPTEYVARKLVYFYLKGDEHNKLEPMVFSMIQHGFTAGVYSERALKTLLKNGSFYPCREIVRNKWCKVSECANLLFRYGLHSELLALIDDEIDFQAGEVEGENALALQYWVKIYAAKNDYDVIKEVYKRASSASKKAIVATIYSAPELKDNGLSMDLLEAVYADSDGSDMVVATRLVKLYRRNGQPGKASSLAKKIIEREKQGAYNHLYHLSRVADACEALGNNDKSVEIRNTINHLKTLLHEAEKL